MKNTFVMTPEMKAATSILGWGYNKNSWSVSDIHKQAHSNCVALIRVYNAHAIMGEMLDAAFKAIGELDAEKSYTKAEAEAMLKQADVAVRELLDD